jgi:hypothetical protein
MHVIVDNRNAKSGEGTVVDDDVHDNPTLLLRGIDAKCAERAAMGRYVKAGAMDGGGGAATLQRPVYTQSTLVAGQKQHCVFYAGPEYDALPDVMHTSKWVVAELPDKEPRLYAVDDAEVSSMELEDLQHLVRAATGAAATVAAAAVVTTYWQHSHKTASPPLRISLLLPPRLLLSSPFRTAAG